MAEYLDAFGSRLGHLDIQDILPASERDLPDAEMDHYTPGTGAIPESDRRLLFGLLEETEHDGLAMIETRPRNPLFQGSRARSFLEETKNNRRVR